MVTRIGRVTQVHNDSGKVTVAFEDEKSASLPIPMLTMNREYSMPKVGERVVTMHLENGSSKAFVLGTYYSGGGLDPAANSGYRKDYESGAYTTCNGGAYRTSAGSVGITGKSRASMTGGGAGLTLNGNAGLVGAECTLASAAASEDEETEEIVPDVYIKITEDKIEQKSVNEIEVKAEGGNITITSEGGNVEVESEAGDVSIKSAANITIEASADMTLKCSYGEETLENILKRIERIEDMLGLPHTI